MILLLDTSTPTCKVTLVSDDSSHDFSWESGRQLAKGLLEYLEKCLEELGKTLDDVDMIGVYRGPGSFTGLRIGVTVANTIAESSGIAIVGETGDDWQNLAIKRLRQGDNDQIVMPIYGSEAHITKQRK
ncbi:MAG: tRNA (adenosine(37)-N6)-threonylcarbamoyltransferase complex dimerization subunit type 1 TsaB [bacterium]|nr:tRNA (adenosine(37)-N6)-threonylcarbamoyltransferase complex dimerization subunit type 1 TsaB [bacterium]MDN5835296.1 tRNA (adenosine(37)-N6)-threonylcarbamoyltransferase complex dimerization subunit type 1 TsaB [bacterium]